MLSNNFGKDITAYYIVFRDGESGPILGTFHQELLDSLGAVPPAPQIFRSKTQRVIPVAQARPDCKVFAVAAIFVDRSAVGDPKDVATLLDSRAKGLARFKDRMTLLDEVRDYNAALTLHQRTEAARSTDERAAVYLDTLAKRLERSRSSSDWEAFVTQQQQRLRHIIDNYESHLHPLTSAGQ